MLLLNCFLKLSKLLIVLTFLEFSTGVGVGEKTIFYKVFLNILSEMDRMGSQGVCAVAGSFL